jgi:ribosomal protein S27E
MVAQVQIARRRFEQAELPKAPVEDFDRIQCRDCGRSYPALDGPALLYSLKASCPHCGGGFVMEL